MKNAKEFWLESKEVKFPIVFDSDDYDYTIRDMNLWCPICKHKATQLRGDVKEVFGCIEMRISGICESCKVVADNRTRIYPKQHRFITLGDDGVWMEGDMKVSFLQTVVDFFKRLWYAFKQ